MVKKILFFVEATFNQRDYKRFGFEQLKSRGFEVHVWDFTPLLRSKVFHNYSPRDAKKYKYHEIIADKSDFNKLSERLNSVIVLMLIGLRSDTKFIFEQLINNKIFFGFMELGLTPNRPRYLFEKILSTIQNPKLLLSKLISSFQTQINDHIYPNFIIVGGEKIYQGNRYPQNNNIKYIKAHSLDYDLYLNQEDKNSGRIVSDDYAVFLDECVPSHPAYYYENIKPECSSKNYYPDINIFFDKVKSEFDTKVIIAAHPRSDYHKKGNPFNKRQYIYNETTNLVKYSKFVIVHASTATNFAVLYNKPIIFISSTKYSTKYQKSIRFHSSVFNKSPINICQDSTIDFETEMKIDNDSYKNYKEDYIKETGTPEKSVWEIFADNIN